MIPAIRNLAPLFLVTASLLICAFAFEVSGHPQVSSTHRFTPPRAEKSVEIGTFYLKKKNYKAALSRFLEAIKTDPFYAPAHGQLGKVYEKLGKREEALRSYRTHLEVLPSAREAAKATDVRKAITRLELDLRRNPPKRK